MKVPDPVRRRAEAQGEAGRAWLAGLGELVRGLADAWGLTLGRTLTGGSAALVATATTAQGRRAILKVSLPGEDPDEARVLLAAQGRGYAEVLRHDAARHALLLERLGPQLSTLGLSTEAQSEAICATLKEAWTVSPGAERFTTGAEKARDLAAFIAATWLQAGKPCAERTIEAALAFAEARGRAFDPDKTVLAHGDGHSQNTLLVPDPGPRRFKFVDPDGLQIEPAYDLGILMRDWGAELLAGDPVALGRRRCDLLARLTGVEPEPIWQWGFIERVSTGLLLKTLRFHKQAREFLTVADAWARA